MMITFFKTEADGAIRYYSVHNRQPHFFSRYSFTAIWGLDQGTGREKVYTFRTRREMDLKMREIFEERLSMGYKVLYTYAKKRKYRDMFSAMEQKHA